MSEPSALFSHTFPPENRAMNDYTESFQNIYQIEIREFRRLTNERDSEERPERSQFSSAPPPSRSASAANAAEALFGLNICPGICLAT